MITSVSVHTDSPWDVTRSRKPFAQSTGLPHYKVPLIFYIHYKGIYCLNIIEIYVYTYALVSEPVGGAYVTCDARVYPVRYIKVSGSCVETSCVFF